jgi:hypothetical protein
MHRVDPRFDQRKNQPEILNSHDRLRAALGPSWRVRTDCPVAPRGNLRLFDFNLLLYVADAAPGSGPHRWTLWDAGHDFIELELGIERELDVDKLAADLREFVVEEAQ